MADREPQTELQMEQLTDPEDSDPDSVHRLIKNNKRKELIDQLQSCQDSAQLEECLLKPNEDGEIPLHIACKYDKSGEMVEVLLNFKETKKKQLEAENGIYGNTPLHVAACLGNEAAVSSILKHAEELYNDSEYPDGEYPEGEYPEGEYPEGEYPEGEYPKGSELLFKHNKLKDTPVHGAVSRGHMSIVQQMYEVNKKCIEEKGRYGRLPIHTACGYGQIEVAKMLLKWKKSTLESEAPVPASLPALSYTTESAKKLSKEEKETLKDRIEELQRNEKVEQISDDVVTPLVQACQFGHPEIVKFLLKEKAKTNHIALRRAIAGLYTDCVYELLFIFEMKERRTKFRSPDHCRNLLHKPYKLHSDLDTSTTAFRELIKHMPEIAEHVLQNCVKCDRFLITSENFGVILKYEFVDNVEKKRNQQTNDKHSKSTADDETQSSLETAHPLSLMV